MATIDKLPAVKALQLHANDPTVQAYLRQLEEGADIWEVIDHMFVYYSRHTEYLQDKIKLYREKYGPLP